ncbi:PIN domain-containing protein [Synechocystis sp. LEGE 06083]|uniref:PIN domain-containing protein n=1 Tax=Synechocystis sp. LEGE 06083 TaxID=915336 RepID=UPI0018822A2F|nr:PIN domain-containing protein [Synechocystis sp. LEGE 06083]MBE9194228.1 PIN domain-containing protein [Synechocystis sp. LEGE 06083]
MAVFPVLLDSCVLYPMYLRDTLLCCAEIDLYQVRWTEEILEGAFRNLIKDNRIDRDKANNLNATMNKAFPEALIEMTDHLLPCMDNNSGDRHVLAAALVAKVEVIVTSNLKHFPKESLQKFNVVAQSPDDFLLSLLDLSFDELMLALTTQANRTRKPKLGITDLLDTLRTSVPNFSKNCLNRISR